MLKLQDNPLMRPAFVQSVADLDGDWWVAHTKARFEKALAHDLAAQGIGYFLPMVERVKMSGGRKRRLMMPLFTSYVFLCGDAHARYAAMATNRCCQTIKVTDRDRFVEELVGIERALTCDAYLDLYPFAVIGRRCRVRSGKLIGTVGTLVERGARARFVLQVSMISKAALLEIDADLLEPIDD